MTGRRRQGFSRIEPGALIGLAVLALAYWGTVATLVMARDSTHTTTSLESAVEPVQPIERAAPFIRLPPIHIPARRWCFSDRFNSLRYGQTREIGLALEPPCNLPLRHVPRPYPSSSGILLAN